MTERIALVDDAPFMLILLRNCLRAEGFNPIRTFYGPGECYDAVLAGYRPHVIVTEFIMPEMNGKELLAAVERLTPHVEGILTAGNAYEAGPCKYPIIQKGRLGFHKELSAAVSQALAHSHLHA